MILSKTSVCAAGKTAGIGIAATTRAAILSASVALDRLIGAVLIEMDEAWHCERMRYLVMDEHH